ncbi:MAG: hypothetical protein REI94_18110 [Moraxellaceae bacterium]|nr:hypothetical protein [Moraxellaceae bacterium]
MEIAALFKLLLLFVHLLAFAVAAGYVMREDVRFLRSGEIQLEALAETAYVAVRALALLWVTGVVMILIDTSGDLSLLASKPKLLAKLTVVSLLTINGVLLHKLAFPTLEGTAERPLSAAMTAVVGAVSAVSWMYAAFVGIAKPLAPVLGYSGFIGLYLLALGVGVGVALTVLRPRIERVLSLQQDRSLGHGPQAVPAA